MYWFTSDLHFGHSNIIKYCDRPFKNVEEMNAQLIARWNVWVTNEDTVYVIGDFTLTRKLTHAFSWLSQLAGTKHLVIGNHDHKQVAVKEVGWASAKRLVETEIDGQRLTLCHDQLNDFRGPGLQLHGHSHSKHWKTSHNTYDVGVDANDYAPVALSTIVSRMAP